MLRMAWREVRNHPRFAVFFAANLALGFTGFVALDAFETSVSRALEERSQAFLGADVAVTSSRPLTAAEIADLDAAAAGSFDLAHAVVLFSMAGAADRARLVELRAVDGAFPLYGEIQLEESEARTGDPRARLRDAPGAWVDPPLLAQLGVEVGRTLRIGSADFEVQGVVARDGGRASSGFSIAPRVYIDLAHLEATGLVATGSRVEYQRLYRLAEGGDSVAVASAMRRSLPDERTSARAHTEATRDLARTYGAVTRYLGMVALVAIFLAGLGAAHLFRAHLGRRVSDLAILVSLGATRGRAQAIFLTQLAFLGAVAALAAAGLAALLLPWLAGLAADALPHGFVPRVGWRSVLVVVALATLGSTAACLPLVVRLRRLRPAELFAEQARPVLASAPRDALWWLPAAAGFFAVACWRAGSLQVGSAFAAVFGASAVFFAVLGVAAIAALSALPSARGLAPRLAVRELVRGRARTLSGFVSLALCALLVSLVPQMRTVLDRDLETPDGHALPSLFLFDIQPEQRDALAEHVALRGAALERISPMVRARLDRVKGEPVGRPPSGDARPSRMDRDAEAESRRLRSRRYNLTYRAALTDSEVMRAGRPFSGPRDPRADGPAEMSLEVDFAERLGVGIGDTLSFDVQGVPVEGVTVNLREVRWNSFQPNFFVLFQPGVLEEAPAIYLASVPSLTAEARDALQASIQAEFPNVSTIDVTRAVRRLLGMIEQLHWAIAGSAVLSLGVGWMLVLALARDAARARRWEMNLLKVLGADLRDIRRALDLEFGLLGLLAGFAGASVSIAAAWALTRFVLEVPWTPAAGPLLAPLVGIPLVCVLSARMAARRVLRERPLALLQSASAGSSA